MTELCQFDARDNSRSCSEKFFHETARRNVSLPHGGHVSVIYSRRRRKDVHRGIVAKSVRLLEVYKISGTDLTPVAEAKIGHWCQGMVWSKDSKHLVAQCMVESELIAFSFNGTALNNTSTLKMQVSPAG